ncbi:MAG: NAD(P)H-binding protein [Deltaproteobacteria bacterium]
MEPFERPRRLFVAGATGETGKVVVRLAAECAIPAVPHARPRRAGGSPAPAGALLFELSDRAALEAALGSCTTVLQLIGTTRSRFASGDSYEASDIGTTRQLTLAARAAGIDHFILLSSVGAGRPFGAYLRAKAEAERIVRESGIDHTLFRPSVLVGGERWAPPGSKAVTRLLGLRRFEPIELEELARAMLGVANRRAPLNCVLEGETLWEAVATAG